MRSYKRITYLRIYSHKSVGIRYFRTKLYCKVTKEFFQRQIDKLKHIFCCLYTHNKKYVSTGSTLGIE